jgi:outer membrane protein OmpA-like peptidoglycan-associated protein
MTDHRGMTKISFKISLFLINLRVLITARMASNHFLKTLVISLVFSGFVDFVSAQDDQQSLGQHINSKYNELDPVLSPDGSKLYFTRTKHPDNIGGRKDPGDIWVADLNAIDGESASNIGTPVNTNDMNGVIGFSNDGNIMYLQSYNRNRESSISFSRKTSGGWSKPQQMPVKFFHNKSDLQSMCISADGRTIVMSIESYSTYGAEDLYVSHLQDNGTWSEPKNLGPVINTKFQETTPRLADDQVTLFFSSNGHGGYGGRDIFVTQRMNNSWTEWTKPENLGQKVNTKGVELSYFIPATGDYAYMVSTQNSDGYGDLKRVPIRPADRPNATVEPLGYQETELPTPDTVLIISEQPITAVDDNPTVEMIKEIVKNPAVTIEGQVVNATTKNPVFARIDILSTGDNQPVNSVATNVSNGSFSLNIPSDSLFNLLVKADGYMSYETTIYVQAGEEQQLDTDFELIPLEVGVTIQLPNVLFERSTTTLLNESFQELDQVVQLLEEHPEMEIALSGHTDNQGSAKLNLKLSQDRVETVMLYLVGKGISRNRLSGKGYGGTKPIASNRSEQTRKLNRRVEFTIVKK